ncbi:hypothetical protein G9U51_09415 [Calidifontibacter sp. DB0510]|uniref:Type I restriction modification DNA specificity domain-containing protein n=1 Tax=Metallococcus carri TaxID=1656884 RepID=A0A967B1W6_9MICO|nr:restriction endonuclease subunit S [Metallococcus carri]NHN55993.1 hypothetical protein [Metallococcus carri]NOP37550.1 hypothetical protein [Calidifontibacter sp. DB2511S]
MSGTVSLGDATVSHSSRRVPVKGSDRRVGPYPYWGASGVVDYVDDYLFDKPMLLVSEDGENLLSRKTPIAFIATGKYWVNNHAHVLAAAPGYDLRFLYYFVSTYDFNGHGLVTGSGQPKLNAANLRRVRVPSLPLEEQERIAGVLGAFDDLIETNRRLSRHANDLQRAAFLRATDGLLRVAISELMQVEMGQSPPGHTYNSDGDGLPFFQGVKDFGDRYPAIRIYCSEPRRIAEPGDLLLAVRAPIGRVNVATERCATGRGLAILRSANSAVALQALTAQPDLWAAYEDEGTVFSSINRKVISEQRIRWSNDPVLADVLETLDHLVLDCHEQNVALARQRDELLSLLMSGKVRVRDVEVPMS